VTVGAAGFLIFSQLTARPDRDVIPGASTQSHRSKRAGVGAIEGDPTRAAGAAASPARPCSYRRPPQIVASSSSRSKAQRTTSSPPRGLAAFRRTRTIP